MLYSDFELKSVLIHLNHQSIIYLVLSFYLTDISYILYTLYNKLEIERWLKFMSNKTSLSKKWWIP